MHKEHIMKVKIFLPYILTLVASLTRVSSEQYQAIDNTPSSITESSSSFEFIKPEHKEEWDEIFKDRNLQGSSSGGSSSSTSTHVNIFQKLKESLGLAIIGFILICCAPVFIWKNEGRYVNELKKIDFCKNEAIVVDR